MRPKHWQLPDELWMMIFSTAVDMAAIAKAHYPRNARTDRLVPRLVCR